MENMVALASRHGNKAHKKKTTLSKRAKKAADTVGEDLGPNPAVINVRARADHNDAYRAVIWTGKHMQLTLMSIKKGKDIGLEMHRDTDQYLYVESGEAMVHMSRTKNNLMVAHASKGSAIMIPAGTWHNVTNVGKHTLKLQSIYTPPQHRAGTVQKKAYSSSSSSDETMDDSEHDDDDDARASYDSDTLSCSQ